MTVKFRKPLRATVKGTLFLLFALFFLVYAVGSYYQLKHRSRPYKIGVSFSIKAAEGLGVSWQDNLTALLDDLKFRNFRLMSYWDRVEKEQGRYDFSELDWQLNEVAKRGGKVTLAIGARQPRWPECHTPKWISKDNLEDNLSKYLTAVVGRYKDHPAIESYQLENEFANRHFADCFGYDPARLEREMKLVKSLDDDTPINTNASNQSGVPAFGAVGDRIGFSIYKRAHFQAFGRQWPWSFGYVPTQWHSFRAQLIEMFHDGKQSFIHELQAEPWGPKPIIDLSIEEQDRTMNASKLIVISEYAKQTGIHEMYFWGSEWWYWRKVQLNEPSVWEAARTLVQ